MNYNLRVPAAERRKNVDGRKPVHGIVSKSQPRRGARFLECIRIFRPSGAGSKVTVYPGLAPGATLCRRSAAILKTRTVLLPEALWSVLHRSVCRMKPADHRACLFR